MAGRQIIALSWINLQELFPPLQCVFKYHLINICLHFYLLSNSLSFNGSFDNELLYLKLSCNSY